MEDNEVFMFGKLPARLSIEQAGQLLGFDPDTLEHVVDIGVIQIVRGPVPDNQTES